jgi:hypothetical protein
MSGPVQIARYAQTTNPVRQSIAVIGLAVVFGAPALAQSAQEQKRWVASASVSGIQPSDGEAELGSGNLSLEYSDDASWFGASIGSARGSVRLPEILTVSDQSSLQGSVWLGRSFDGLNVEASLGLGRQSLEGDVTASGAAPLALRGRRVLVDGSVTSASVGLLVSSSFGSDVIITPSAGLSYAATEREVDVRLIQGAGGVSESQTLSGITGSLGLDVTGSLSSFLTLSAGAALVATDEAGSQAITFVRNRPSAPQADLQTGSAEWAEAYVSANLAATDTVTVGASIGTTVGLEQDEAFASVTVSRAF